MGGVPPRQKPKIRQYTNPLNQEIAVMQLRQIAHVPLIAQTSRKHVVYILFVFPISNNYADLFDIYIRTSLAYEDVATDPLQNL